ncbi:MAG: hypothetical protein GX892_13720 [Thermoanaerobacteraceae bacterium]|nr:hypothetical protein [Thermoanaerobacteraceae bacterium]
MTQISESRGIIIPRQDRLTEFQFNEPISTPSAIAIPLVNAKLAEATINVNNNNDLVLITATVGWFNTFTEAAGVVAATFTINRNGIPIASVIQTVSNPSAVSGNIFNIARIIFVDQPLPEIIPYAGSFIHGDVQVTYTLTSDASDDTAATTGPITLTLSEIGKNL